jgi:putative IMPACT (imprinted ancient) family translation regulator
VTALTVEFRLGKATQVSWAARIGGMPVTEIREDGGESGASRCILDVMRAAGAVDCLVLVARWYGGRHLGGARFRMYSGLAAKLLRESGQVP